MWLRGGQILRSKPPGTRIIIFCSTKRMCDQLTAAEPRVRRGRHPRRQASRERDHVIASFKDGRMPIMCAPASPHIHVLSKA